MRNCGRQVMLGKSGLTILAGALVSCALPAWGQDWTQRLPDGKGKETVVAVCAGCHEFFSRLGAGYTPDGWRTVMRMMINQGTPIPPDQVEAVTEYLIQSFPEKPKPPGVTIPGPVEVSIKIWPVPTPGSRPHDPLATATARSGTRGSWRMCSAGSIRRPAKSRNTRSRRRIRAHMASWRIKTATSGTPRMPRA